MPGDGDGKTVLILGAGMVTRPIIHYLANKGYKVIVGSRTVSKVEGLIQGAPNTTAITLDIETPEGEAAMDEYAPQVDGIVSLLPYLFHCKAAAYALKHNVHFFTSSYVSEDMTALEAQAKEKNLVFINECGVDPGTDHMSAFRVIDAIRAKGGWITSFTSYCGGLPHPDNNDNPLGYKFSWAPRGVLLASRNTAKFLKDGKDTTIEGAVLFDNFEQVEVEGVCMLECYPNRDSRQYKGIYGILKAKTLIRGTFRNQGWCPNVKKLVDCGYLSLDERDLTDVSFLSLLAGLVKSSATDEEGLVADVVKHLGLDNKENTVIKTMKWLGLFSGVKIGAKAKTALDALCQTMLEKMAYKDGERDMIAMQHGFLAEYPDGTEEKHTSTMMYYGEKDGDTAMAKTVTLPLAMAVNLVLTGKYSTPGLSIPIVESLYKPILDELEEVYGVKWVETSETIKKCTA